MCALVLANDIASCAPLRGSSHSDLPRGGTVVCCFPLHAAPQWSLSELAGYGSYAGAEAWRWNLYHPTVNKHCAF